MVDNNYLLNGASSSAHMRSPRLRPLAPITAEHAPTQPRSEQESTVSLIIPTRNEARNVADVLERVPETVGEVLLVDTRSSDVTRLMARSTLPDIRIIEEPKRGKGNALRAGLAAATGDILVAMDADGSMSPEEIPRLVNPLHHGFDFTKGSRFMGGGNSLDITPIRGLGNWGLTQLVNVLFKARFTDLCYGFFAVRRIFLDALELSSTGFEIETEIVLRAERKGLRIAEVPSVELPRRNGRSNLHAGKDGIRVLRTILAEYRASRAPEGLQMSGPHAMDRSPAW
jgi:glycosyltransferase involved in cell wall biosynthesis